MDMASVDILYTLWHICQSKNSVIQIRPESVDTLTSILFHSRPSLYSLCFGAPEMRPDKYTCVCVCVSIWEMAQKCISHVVYPYPVCQ